MKVGVISDTHIPSIMPFLPAAVFEVFRGVDLILHAGDIVDFSVIEELGTLAPVEAVAGNMDDLSIQVKLPRKKIIQIGGHNVGLIHGKYKIDIQKEMVLKEFTNVDLIVFGHSHTPFWGKFGDTYLLNPGSPTDKRYAPYNSVALLHIGGELSAEIVRL